METVIHVPASGSVQARKHLPFGWGGTLKDGGGWSGAILRALEILSKEGVYIDE